MSSRHLKRLQNSKQPFLSDLILTEEDETENDSGNEIKSEDENEKHEINKPKISFADAFEESSDDSNDSDTDSKENDDVASAQSRTSVEDSYGKTLHHCSTSNSHTKISTSIATFDDSGKTEDKVGIENKDSASEDMYLDSLIEKTNSQTPLNEKRPSSSIDLFNFNSKDLDIDASMKANYDYLLTAPNRDGRPAQRRTGQQHQRLANMIRAGNHGWKKSMNRNFIFGQPKDNWPKPPSIINGGKVISTS